MEVVSVESNHRDPRCSSPDLPEQVDLKLSDPYETVATLPLDRVEESPTQYDSVRTLPINAAATQETNKMRPTQPTQLINRSSPDLPTSPTPTVQVAASSPMTSSNRRPSGILASAMAPAGTSFRRPFVLPKPQPAVISLDSDDEGPTYQGGSSDSDRATLRKNDIKTTNFSRAKRDTEAEKVPESPHANPGLKKFGEITANSFYRPTNFVVDPRIKNPNKPSSDSFGGSGVNKRTFDSMSSAYGSVTKRPRQIAPARAQPIDIDAEGPEMTLHDIIDPNMRAKTKRLHSVHATDTIRACHDALVLKRGNYDDASIHLLDLSERKKGKAIDLTGSEDELMMTPAIKPHSGTTVNQSRQQARKPAISIHDKWSSTQNVVKPQPKQLNVFGEPKKRGKLIRGQRQATSPAPVSPKPELKADVQTISDDSDEEDSGIHSSPEDASYNGRLLTFFNSCSENDLSDMAGISLDVAGHLISKRPFKSLDAISGVEAANAKPGKGKRKLAPIGDKIREKCADMLRSYEAVDYLVNRCENIAKPLANEMKTWGVNIFGTTDGELDMVSLRDSQRAGHDSGIGTPVSDLGDDRPSSLQKGSMRYIGQPSLMSDDIQMKDYQVVGINWLALLFKKGLSGILADDMGLGKTCQVIAFLAWLLENGEKGPHLIVVPAATLENWLKEFKRFCPALKVEPYYSNQPSERIEMAAHIDSVRDDINVVITTYTLAKAKDDFPWLKHFGFCCTIFDEGHYLKNAESKLASKLVRIQSKFRLLLTGTPLQNNLKELISLLAFLMPSLFKEKEQELQSIFTLKVKAMDANHEALLSAQRISRARSMLTPFILRRKKNQVLKDLPRKERRVEWCELTPEQAGIYTSYLERALDIRTRRANGENVFSESTNILMKLRQAAIHPFLFRRCYKDEQLPRIAKTCLRDPQWTESNPDLIVQELQAYSDMELHSLCDDRSVLRHFALNNHEWLASGKVQKMLELLRDFIAKGHFTLVFSQFTMVLDILELVFEREAIAYFRLDGNTKVAERQDLIDEFCAEDNETPVFMLSTKAGGAGINLAKASKVIVFDSGFNPQDDIQAENRAHRIGQTKEVEVIRLVSKGTVEEQIYAMGLTKLKLDEKVAGDGAGEEASGNEKDDETREAEGRSAVEEMFWNKLEEKLGTGEEANLPALKDEDQKTEQLNQLFGKGEGKPSSQEAARGKDNGEVKSEEHGSDARLARKESVELPSRTRPEAVRRPSRTKAELDDM